MSGVSTYWAQRFVNELLYELLYGSSRIQLGVKRWVYRAPRYFRQLEPRFNVDRRRLFATIGLCVGNRSVDVKSRPRGELVLAIGRAKSNSAPRRRFSA